MLQIHYYHSTFYHLLDNHQQLRKISAAQPGGLCWSARSGRLDYVDANTGKKFVWTETAGEKEDACAFSRMTCLVRDCCDRLVGVEAASASLARWHEEQAVRFAGDIAGKKLTPVSVAPHSCGILYFAEPSGVYYVLPESFGVMKAYIHEGLDPVCIALSPDENIFYLSDKADGCVHMLDFEHDARLARLRTLAFASEFPCGAPAHMAADRCGRLYCASPAGIHIFDSVGLRLARLTLPGVPLNVCAGGRDGQTLFLGTTEGIYTVTLNL
ncbi:MAG: SMP-30/gluconolactonase/LRE family protein [Spirochaetales bacterium]|jgi:sugar lactone lactonase YvrE|nr:SMP-30/gluconolactonase/LRE family protein [Spirochaetales bacterium]